MMFYQYSEELIQDYSIRKAMRGSQPGYLTHIQILNVLFSKTLQYISETLLKSKLLTNIMVFFPLGYIMFTFGNNFISVFNDTLK